MGCGTVVPMPPGTCIIQRPVTSGAVTGLSVLLQYLCWGLGGQQQGPGLVGWVPPPGEGRAVLRMGC